MLDVSIHLGEMIGERCKLLVLHDDVSGIGVSVDICDYDVVECFVCS